MGEGPSYQEQQRGRVQCNQCREEMALGLMVGHMQTQHGRAAKWTRSWEKMSPSKEQWTYRPAFPTAGVPQN